MKGWRRVALVLAWLWSAAAAAREPLYLWELRDGAGTLRAWLYGTIHVCDAACFPLPADVRAALEAADGLALELDPEDPELGPRLGRAGLLAAATRLDDLLPADLRPRVASAAARVGVPQAVLQRLQPWMAGTLLTLRAAQQAGFETAQGVDLWLARAARARGLPLRALESVDRQVEALSAGGEAAQRASLAEIVELIEAGAAKEYFVAMLEAWRRGDVAALERLLRDQAASPDLAPLLAELLDRRNREMADAIVGDLQPGRRTFIAVGAGHFGGSEGLLAALAARGFRLRQVEAGGDD